MRFEVELKGSGESKRRTVELEKSGGGYNIRLDGEALSADAVRIGANTISILLGGQSFEVFVSRGPDGSLKLQTGGHEFTANVEDPRAWRGRKHGAAEAEGRQAVVAPMPGKVIRLLVKGGDTVEAGQGLVVVEAMKMQNEIRSPKSGKVERVTASEGQTVNAGDVLVWVE